jgi:hypothetical protein
MFIDAIMRQTIVLIAQFSATAGIRAPLAHLADEVFLRLSEELESQGVSRKLVADMFGMTLRTYQRRVQRLRESATDQGKTLWQSVLEHLERKQCASRRELLDRFRHDDPEAVAAVLNESGAERTRFAGRQRCRHPVQYDGGGRAACDRAGR